jgi:hypothetical protein
MIRLVLLFTLLLLTLTSRIVHNDNNRYTCKPFQRGVRECPLFCMAPVCGHFYNRLCEHGHGTETQCQVTACNNCDACRDPRVQYVTPGAC